MEKYQILNRDTIKYIAMFTMLLNHIANIFMYFWDLPTQIFLDVGYFTAITMCYFLVEGYGYTHSKKAYGQRLLIFALISQIPYSIAFAQGQKIIGFRGLNMIFTLFVCFLILVVREKIENPVIKYIIIAGLVAVTVISDWALYAALFTLMFAAWKDNRKKLILAYAIAIVSFGTLNWVQYRPSCSLEVSIRIALGTCMGILLSGIVILFLYNGRRMERGRTFSKWFFYIFYPGHLLILALIRIWMM